MSVSDITDAPAPPVLSHRHGRTLVLTMNRPHVHNAVDSRLSEALGAALATAAEARDEVRVVVITGAGASFSSGADLRELSRGRSISPDAHAEWGFAGLVRHVLPQPVIAAVNGAALGGGFEIALACDLVVAARTASFGLPEVTRGRLASAGGLLRLPRQLPVRIAMDLALTGRPLPADEALRWGVVNEVVDEGEALPVALRWAERIASHAPLAVQGSKKVIYGALDLPMNPIGAWDLSEQIAQAVRSSLDAAEGARAFVEKRAPNWEGR